jgi:hypothetical protein
LIEVNAHARGLARFAVMSALMNDDDLSAAEDGPRFEIQAIGRTLGDLSPDEKIVPAPRGRGWALASAGLALVALIAFVGWMLLSPPLAT